MKIRNTKGLKVSITFTFILLGIVSFAHYYYSNQIASRGAQTIVETKVITRTTNLNQDLLNSNIESAKDSTERLILESSQNIQFVTSLFNWSQMNSLTNDFIQNSRTFESLRLDLEALISGHSLKGLGVDIIRSELTKIDLLNSSILKLNESLTIINKNKNPIPDVISFQTNSPDLVVTESKVNVNLFYFIEMFLISVMGILFAKITSNFEHNSTTRQLSKTLESNFALETGFASTVFDLSGKCLHGSKNLNTLLDDFKTADSGLIEDWPSVAELVGLNNSYSLKELPEGINRYNIKAKKIEGNDVTLEIIFDINLKRNRVGVLFKKELIAHKNNSSILELPDLKVLEHIDVIDTVGAVLEKLSPFFIAKGVTVNFTESEDLSLRGNRKIFEEKITNIMQVLVQNCAEKNNLRSIEISTTKFDDTAFINFLIDGKELGLNLLLDVINGKSIEEELCSFEREFKYLDAKVSLKNNYDSKNKFMFSDVSLEAKVIG